MAAVKGMLAMMPDKMAADQTSTRVASVRLSPTTWLIVSAMMLISPTSWMAPTTMNSEIKNISVVQSTTLSMFSTSGETHSRIATAPTRAVTAGTR